MYQMIMIHDYIFYFDYRLLSRNIKNRMQGLMDATKIGRSIAGGTLSSHLGSVRGSFSLIHTYSQCWSMSLTDSDYRLQNDCTCIIDERLQFYRQLPSPAISVWISCLVTSRDSCDSEVSGPFRPETTTGLRLAWSMSRRFH